MRTVSVDLTPRVVSMGCVVSSPRSCCDWHSHPFDELCLIEGAATTIGHGGRQYRAQPGALFLFRARERHGFWNDARAQQPKLWVMHFTARKEAYRHLEPTAAADPRQRIWRLTPRQVTEYLAEFGRVAAEHTSSNPGSAAAESARIRLLLVNILRWASKSGDSLTSSSPSAAPDDPQLLPLWRLVAESSEPVGALMKQLSARIPNYDSLRHRFRRMFGCSPRQMVVRVRLSRARSLLIESSMSIKEIAAAVGYGRQHEFTRAFRRLSGASPTEFRRHPVLINGFR